MAFKKIALWDFNKAMENTFFDRQIIVFTKFTISIGHFP